ncbi:MULTISPECIES: SCO family protein [Rhodopseudomonas]|uniref:Electron transporter SenC n=1 Tax=Rhodopseudomonas palustris TaxID=1076 RepID=A0A0D7EHC9_RHOPL|nr:MULTISPECIES: SCO family protein [Rhodopseudomonas]KIZ40081.1 electron transporter SenC [Rhodopseudomonas palustris]MDF3812027.1 SCO family protein [Rhodopseudomonas sp. BAL398]WOK21093.1 SCO family protein [Rhodopseudomonas sp. BAL398]
MRSLRKFLIIVALAIATSVAIAWAWRTISPVTPPLPKPTTSGTPLIGGPFTLVATNGEVVSEKTYLGKWALIFFGYTFCPDVCPTTLNNMTVALEKLGSDAVKIQPMFITIDPARDTRDVLSEYLKSFDSRILGLTGTQAQIDRVVKEYRIYVAQQKSGTDDRDYLVSHSGYLYLMSPTGKFVSVIQGSEDGEAIASWLRKEISRSRQ